MGNDLTARLLMQCAICGEAISGGVVPFVVRSPEGHAGHVAAHNDCLFRSLHPTVGALLTTAPVIGADESPEEIKYHVYEVRPPVVTLGVYLQDGVDTNSPAVHEFYADARTRLVPGMSMAGGPHKQEIPPDMEMPPLQLLSIAFSPENVPDPFWDIRDWLRSHPLVRLIEVDHPAPRSRAV